jgi:hypothetical protein
MNLKKNKKISITQCLRMKLKEKLIKKQTQKNT